MPPPPSVPSISPSHSQAPDASAQRRQSPSPQRVLDWDGLRHMRGQACKTTGLPPRRQMAPRDEPNTIHEVGESSHQAELMAQLQQVTQDLQGTHQSLQQCQAIVEDTSMTALEILTSHLTLLDQVKALDTDTRAWRVAVEDRMRMTWGQIVLAAFWRQVALMRERWVRMREVVRDGAVRVIEGVSMLSLEARMVALAIVLATIVIVMACLPYFLR
ncbi:hypothetical protein E3N88_15704 [Mikania micrantha]|uniref:Uncharacterized protein n=1 Tax=Mikania micrantha TaxID=192012 RepID=A0A5N6NWC4_9ASTR|nr:hypothetical protein E3N88_15704 [Mikania micrantha]